MQDKPLQHRKFDVYAETDFPADVHRHWGLSDNDYTDLKALLIGRPVGPQLVSDEVLQKRGYSSWKEYKVCSAIKAW